MVQKSSKLRGYIIRKIFARIMLLQFVQHLKRHHKVRQCEFVCNQHVDNRAIRFFSSPHGARLDSAGYESERAKKLPVEPLQNRPSHVCNDLSKCPLRFHHVAHKSLPLRLLARRTIDGMPHMISFQRWGHLPFPLELERRIEFELYPRSRPVYPIQCCSAEASEQFGYAIDHAAAAKPPKDSSDVSLWIDQKRALV